MKNMKRTSFSHAAVGMFGSAIFLLTACVDSDRSAPFATVKVQGAVAEHHVLPAGTAWTLEVEATDDIALSQLRIEIHSAEGHDHGDGSGTITGWTAYSGSWNVLELVDLQGDSSTFTKNFTIPFNVRGEWHLVIQVLDEAGNESPEQVLELEVENDIIPLVHFSSVAGVDPATWVGEPVWGIGSWVDLEGQIQDPDGLSSVELMLHDASGNLLWEWSAEPNSVTVTTLNNVSIPLPFGFTGEVELHASATDVFGYTCETGFHAEVE
jgi:hypothetical protein